MYDISPWKKCDICIVSFTHKHNLKQHTESVHKGNKPFKCEMCNSSFGRKGLLTSHVKKVHNDVWSRIEYKYQLQSFVFISLIWNRCY